MSEVEAPASRAIFSISTGRAGSHYLAEVFRHVEGCVVHHEPTPVGNGATMRRYLRGRRGEMVEVARRKAAAVRQATEAGEVYVETNHCFIKGFGWELMDMLPHDEVGVIELVRDREEIVESSLRIRSSPLAKFGFWWTITPDATETLLPAPTVAGLPHRFAFYLMMVLAAPFRRGHRLRDRIGVGELEPPAFVRRYEERVLGWYVDETVARGVEFRERFPNVRVIRTDVDELNSVAGVTRVVDALGLRVAPTIEGVVGRATNAKPDYGPK